VCFYCGCRDLPLLRDLIAEHEQVTDLGARLNEAVRGGDLATAQTILAEVATELAAHWRGEEEGLFTVLHEDGAYREYIDVLTEEHRELRDLLATADLSVVGDQQRVVAAMEALHAHIAKEEDGLFPASLTALSGEQWDRAIAAWQDAHAADRSAEEAPAR
jgi:iron-sulfur cluster repair protein YtfE (RIC family)